MIDFTYNLIDENFLFNDLDFDPDSPRFSFPSLFSNNSVFNDEISLSFEQFLSNHDLLNNNNNTQLMGRKKPRKHDKTAKDNIKRKIQVNYIKFLGNLLNQINLKLLCN
jgi:hypothetical protein